MSDDGSQTMSDDGSLYDELLLDRMDLVGCLTGYEGEVNGHPYVIDAESAVSSLLSFGFWGYSFV
jgi:hypothetical protein